MSDCLMNVPFANSDSIRSNFPHTQVMAHEENQKYKEGKFILERAKMMDLYEGDMPSSSSADTTTVLGFPNEAEEVCT